ncbi:hypothetical protein COT49_02125 [candidate division WWE3 bacterium CG08_land_8_20_14_0_20_40_13]|uniref:General secretion pathway GspH domain-containing protein n=1 Tax=candidate division WWE3 bacterium CG08_land_8_20_14_0_20_40_13 TaxID=1975084 RepID=A0A2H0XDN6_UNCKA|nr:MAG: hypothetical protein COT49_02125 [candidate division WWE3 bacterium CG08_land_8_20_14_0_20_40_13]
MIGPKTAFTLVELLISLTIIAILMGTLIPTLGNFGKKQSVIQAVENFKSELETVQSKSVSGITVSGFFVRWALKMDCSVAGGAKSYSLGYYNGGNFVSSRTETLGANLSIACTAGDIIFERITGKVTGLGAGQTRSFVFSSTDITGFSKTAVLGERGQVTIQ